MITPANINPLEPHKHSRIAAPERARTNTWLATLIRKREDRLLRAAFQRADDPGLVLDLSRDIGRFWPVLTEKANRRVVAAAADLDEVTQARGGMSPRVAARVYPFSTGLAPIDLPDGAVDCVLCSGRWEQGLDPGQRLALLQEFSRVARETLIVTLPLEGGLLGRATWRGRMARATVEAEFIRAGFNVQMARDLFPVIAPWRVYLLRKSDANGIKE